MYTLILLINEQTATLAKMIYSELYLLSILLPFKTRIADLIQLQFYFYF